MNAIEILTSLVPIMLLIAASAFFSGSETALFSLGSPTLSRWKTRGNRLQRLVARLMEDHHGTLIAILLGTNFVNIFATMLFASFARKVLPQGMEGQSGWAPVIAGLVMTAVLLVFGEVTPKTIAYTHAQKLAPRVARPLSFFVTLFRKCGLIGLLRITTNALLKRISPVDRPPAVSAEEYETFIYLGKSLGVFNPSEGALLEQALRLRDINGQSGDAPTGGYVHH